MIKERWRNVPSEPRFAVSNMGRVRGIRGRIIKGAIQPTGYLDVTVDSAGRRVGKLPRRRSLAEMILEAFVEPRPSPKHQVRHLNDIKIDNRLKNLRWGTARDNAIDRSKNGNAYRPVGILHHNAKITDDDVRAIRKVYRRYGKEHIALAQQLGISGIQARDIGKGKCWAHVQ